MSSIAAGTSAGSALVSTGDTSGALQLQVNGTTPSVTLAANGSIGVGSTPAYGTSGQVLTSAGSAAAPTWSTVSAGFTLGTPVATTSGTSIDFTGIPSGTKQIVVNFYQVSTSGTDPINIQLGDSGGIETTGYIGEGAKITGSNLCEVQNSTSGFRIYITSATSVLNGSITITLQNSSLNQWAASGNISNQGNTQMLMTAGIKPLSAVLDRVRITTTGGSQTFDNGEINIAYI
jgi:hypothetical protein